MSNLSIKTVDVGNDFHYRLIYRDERLGDKKYNALCFREKYLSYLDNQKAWEANPEKICFDFSNVKTIGPSFASEAFAYFTKYATPEEIMNVIIFEPISFVHKNIIENEIKSSYENRT